MFFLFCLAPKRVASGACNVNQVSLGGFVVAVAVAEFSLEADWRAARKRFALPAGARERRPSMAQRTTLAT